MNLYAIEFIHYAPKGNESGIKCYLLAENEDQVFDFIKNEPIIDGHTMYNGWADNEKVIYDENNEEHKDENWDPHPGWFNDEGKPELFKDRIMKWKGEKEDPDFEINNAYYGVVAFGWKLIKEGIEADYYELIRLGVVKTVS